MGIVLVAVTVGVIVGVDVGTGTQKHSAAPGRQTNPEGQMAPPQEGNSPHVCKHSHGAPATPPHRPAPGRQAPEQAGAIPPQSVPPFARFGAITQSTPQSKASNRTGGPRITPIIFPS
jgi:hypothetical protein